MPMQRNRSGTPQAFFSTYDIAEMFSVSAPTARKWMKTGKIRNCIKLPVSAEMRAPAYALAEFAADCGYTICDWLRDSVLYFPEPSDSKGSVSFIADGSAGFSPAANQGATSCAEQEDYSKKIIPLAIGEG